MGEVKNMKVDFIDNDHVFIDKRQFVSLERFGQLKKDLTKPQKPADNYFKNTTAVIERFNIAADCCYDDDKYDKNAEFIKIADFELAKALVLDNRGMALKVAQMILAYHGINDVKVKFE